MVISEATKLVKQVGIVCSVSAFKIDSCVQDFDFARKIRALLSTHSNKFFEFFDGKSAPMRYFRVRLQLVSFSI